MYREAVRQRELVVCGCRDQAQLWSEEYKCLSDGARLNEQEGSARYKRDVFGQLSCYL